MSELIRIVPHNDVYVRIDASESVLRELWHHFSFQIPNHRHNPKVKNRLWDGMIRLLNLRTRLIYAGLRQQIIDFAVENRYDVDDKVPRYKDITPEKLELFFKYIKLPEKINGKDLEVRDYQLESLKIAARDRRAIILSPTSSGKSLSIYMMARWFNQKTLIVVPTTTLVKQLAGDFAEYGYDKEVRQIMAKSNKENLPDITVTTWHSAYAMPKQWLQQFKVIIGDEAHTFTAKSLQTIMENIGAHVRIGLTGSLDGEKVNELTLQGIFGPTHQVATTKELMDRGLVADLTITAYELCYDEETRKAARKAKYDYPEEMSFLAEYPRRNMFIKALVSKLTGNKLILFKSIEHGKALHAMLSESFSNVHLVYGEIDTDIRDEIRGLTERSKDAIIVASYKTFSTGINIRNLHHVILGAAIKAKITLIQAIGRALRLGDGKTKAYVHDIGDNLSIGTYQNHTYRHFLIRLELYVKEQFKCKNVKVQI